VTSCISSFLVKSLEEEDTKTGHGIDETGKGTSRTFGTASTRKGRKQEERRRIMSSFSTDNDVTALEFGCCTRKNKKKRRRAVATGLALELADQRRTAQPHFNHSDTSKTIFKITTTNRDGNYDKRRFKKLADVERKRKKEQNSSCCESLTRADSCAFHDEGYATSHAKITLPKPNIIPPTTKSSLRRPNDAKTPTPPK
jgi:hypothetical protein